MKYLMFKRVRYSTQFRKAAFMLVLTAVLISVSVASAAGRLAVSSTYNVNASFDGVDVNPGDGICAVSADLGSVCTLRAAIQEANLNAGADVINLPPVIHLLTLTGSEGTNTANTAVNDLDITDPAGVTINGLGATLISTIPANPFNGNLAVFEVRPDAVAHIDGVIVENSARAYKNAGHLTLSNGVVRAPALSQGLDGSGTDVHLDNVQVRDSGVGGLTVMGSNHSVEMVDSTFHNNGSAGVTIAGGDVIIRDSTISANGHAGLGGGIQLSAVSNPASLQISNSTISGNENRGLFISGGTVDVSLNNVTITNNHSTGNTVGGGIATPFGASNVTVIVSNSIIAGNTSTGTSPDCSGTIQSAGFNLIGSTAGCTITGDTTGNIISPSPNLAPLADNGGSTQTHALLAGSPAINAGSQAAPGGNGACEATDQIGATRPLDGRCDIGAVEGAAGTAVPPTITTFSPTGVTALGPAFTLTINGSDFGNTAVVRWNGQNRPTTFVNSGQLQVAIPASDLVQGGIVNVTVFDPVQGIGSAVVPFTISNPLPVLNSISPTTARRGFNVQVSVNGSNFVPGAQILLDGSPLPTTFVSSSLLRATIPGTAVNPPGNNLVIRVTNPTPGGGQSLNFGTISVVILPLVGVGSFDSTVAPPGDVSPLTLGWVHPEDWRNLKNMEVRLLDENGNVVLWFGFLEEYGQKGAIVFRDEEGRMAGLGFPGDEASMSTLIGTLDLAASEINAEPGDTIEVVYGVRFSPEAGGQTFQVEITAEDKDGNGQGFEQAGTLTVPNAPTEIYLPLVVTP